MRYLALLAVALALPASPAPASVLCQTRKHTLVVRDACKPREVTVTSAEKVDLGMEGPAGPRGASGPNLGDLELADSTGRNVGVVVSLGSYYGTATVVGPLPVPGPDARFYRFNMGPGGLDAHGTTCSDPDLQYFEASDCTGPPFASCDYGACSSVSGAFLAVPLFAGDGGTACYPGDAAEFRRGDFHQRFTARGLTPTDVANFCQFRGGVLLGSPAPCKPGSKPFYCAPCCGLTRNVGVSPVHTIDASVVGTSPFRLSR